MSITYTGESSSFSEDIRFLLVRLPGDDTAVVAESYPSGRRIERRMTVDELTAWLLENPVIGMADHDTYATFDEVQQHTVDAISIKIGDGYVIEARASQFKQRRNMEEAGNLYVWPSHWTVTVRV